MNVFKKYCPNVWVAECDEEYEKGDIIQLETKYGKEVDCEVHNLILAKNSKYYYSIVRLEEKSYAERKAEKYANASENNIRKSNDYYNKAQEGREFLVLGEPIKVGHHSESRHRSLIERNNKRMSKMLEYGDKADELKNKAEYWERKAEEITLASPESLEYFKHKLEKATEYQKGLKDGSIEKSHSYSLQYATKDVKELKNKVKIATELWG
ncbi:MAG: DUF3560 domain-containing protein [Eubacteriales bacterium]|jgi:hypothetical protein|nr:DUF3560 domain-containing protein [Eubacteriales bacterium]